MGLLSWLFGSSKPSCEPRPSKKVPIELKAVYEVNSIAGLSDEAVLDYFYKILTSEFSEYSVRRCVPVVELVGDANDSFKLYEKRPYQAYKAEWGEPYSFVLSQADGVKAVVMLGAPHSHDEKVKYLISRMYAKKLGVPYINFYTNFPNEVEYVVYRTKKFLGQL